MTGPRRSPPLTDWERSFKMEMELDLEKHAEETRERGGRERERRERKGRRRREERRGVEETTMKDSGMDRARMEAQSRMMGSNLGVGMAHRHGNTFGNSVELRRKRLKRNEQNRRSYKRKTERKVKTMKGDDPIKKEEVEQERLKGNEWNREWYQRSQPRNAKLKLGEKQQEAELIEEMEEDDLLVRSTVKSKTFRKDETKIRFQRKAKEKRKAQIQVEEKEDNYEDDSEEEWGGCWQDDDE